jgi:hypothetical protein
LDKLKKEDIKSIVDENAEYVLGMYDLYQNDNEIQKILRVKGLDEEIINHVLIKVKRPAYEKRITQAKKMIMYGSTAVVALTTIGYLLYRLPNSESLLTSQNSSDRFLRSTFRVYRNGYFYIIVLAAIQTVIGISRYLKYKKLLDKYDQL